MTGKDRKERLADLITLTEIDGVGPARLFQLIGLFGSAEKVLGASVAELTDLPGIGRSIASNIKETQERQRAGTVVADIEKKGWKFFLFDEPDYPEPLQNVSDRPPYLFYFGEYCDGDANGIAIVGSRTASEEGRLFGESLASSLAENNVSVISGMARGIDTSAHRGALDSGGRTIAVLGSSLDFIYPPEGRELARKIVGAGAIMSEFLPGTIPFGPNFPKRNRIISGLSQGVVVIEAAERSGALSTAGHALAQNREVFAVPGSPRSEMSRGTNKLIKSGAKLLTSVDDIFTELPRLKGEVKVRQVLALDDLTDTEKKIIESFSSDPVHIDNLSRMAAVAVPELMQILLALELKGLVKELSGKRYVLNY
ncbi:DNA processing protein [Candidatus Zixiibacteriota bacterium]|nr:DNA processing protein [candidate division Zixibacteria bacterium]